MQVLTKEQKWKIALADSIMLKAEQSKIAIDIGNDIEDKGTMLLVGDAYISLERYYEEEQERKREYTPDAIGNTLGDKAILVFGSNTEGRHGKGLAKLAYDHYGAVWGRAKGLQGQSYAIVTKNLNIGERSIKKSYIGEQLQELIEFARQYKEYKFYITKIGTGLAGYSEQEIEKLFNILDSLNIPDNVILPKEFDKRDEIIKD